MLRLAFTRCSSCCSTRRRSFGADHARPRSGGAGRGRGFRPAAPASAGTRVRVRAGLRRRDPRRQVGRSCRARGDAERIDASFDRHGSSSTVEIRDQLLKLEVHSHALADVGFSGSGRYAWEMRLEQDKLNDEMTCVGAALRPVTNSNYERSEELWMYRAYNGNLYGRSRRLDRQMSKWHPGDVVRCELDLDAGTLSFAVNGEPQGVAFTGLSGQGEIFPACSFYGTGRSVNLLKVERLDAKPSVLASAARVASLADLPPPRIEVDAGGGHGSDFGRDGSAEEEQRSAAERALGAVSCLCSEEELGKRVGRRALAVGGRRVPAESLCMLPPDAPRLSKFASTPATASTGASRPRPGHVAAAYDLKGAGFRSLEGRVALEDAATATDAEGRTARASRGDEASAKPKPETSARPTGPTAPGRSAAAGAR